MEPTNTTPDVDAIRRRYEHWRESKIAPQGVLETLALLDALEMAQAENARLRQALEDAKPLALGWAVHYKHDYQIEGDGYHPTHQAILDKIQAALAGQGETIGINETDRFG